MIPIEKIFADLQDDKEAIGTTLMHLAHLYSSLDAQAAALNLTPENLQDVLKEESFALGLFVGRAWETEDALNEKNAKTAAMMARLISSDGRSWFLRLVPLCEKLGKKFVVHFTDRVSELCKRERAIRSENSAAAANNSDAKPAAA